MADVVEVHDVKVDGSPSVRTKEVQRSALRRVVGENALRVHIPADGVPELVIVDKDLLDA